ncbi:TetR/AcrR family transcriptional regulator [Frondihabitans sp. VKM Ac-2883]|uniref:TetR/AcrR family transcriptional regulator n=1 Tax=Frondihabitans sp. VKM Ac-2883 TaxID=2783823 RepID=UPI00188A5FB6|nr:TetR/AcrR family transcriptional regulator [Frondihabitans sp. VKM Ac-2883]MBF4577530.1 TetR/AcrR family transcriptional regulator [Frondihabitans sp. VKM Ac-2883]
MFLLTSPDVRPLRSDAVRNREQLLLVATRVLATDGTETSMRAIAREAGVGIGTLYRHFPTREALVEAVYSDQVDRLTTGAQELLAQHSPAIALRAWMDLYGEWIAAKSGMLDTLLAMVESGDLGHAQTREKILEAISTILRAGATRGDLRSDVTAIEVSASLIGIFTVSKQAGGALRTDRLLDILLDGLRPTR